MRGLVLLAVSAVTAVAAGCGSTARQVTAHTVGGDSELGIEGADEAGDAPADADAATGAGAGDATDAAAGADGGPNSTARGGSRGGSSGGGSGGDDDGGGSGGSVGPGVTATEIKVGIVYFEGTDSMARAFGPGVNVFGDFKAYYEVAVKDVNAKGGILGRKIVPVYRKFDSTRTDTSVQEQSNCDALTRDTKVFAVLAPSRQSDTFRTCIERAGVVYLAMGGSTPADARTYTQFPHYAEAGSLNLSRLAELLTDHLVAEDFFGPNPSIGVATYDDPSFKRALDRQLKPALARHGLEVKEVLAAPQPANNAEQAATNTAVKTGVVRFQEKGITRVIFLQNGVTLPLLFMSHAAGTTYTPRYALNSTEAPTSLQDSNVPQSQLEGAVGLGWLPSTDVRAGEDTVTPTQTACTALMEANGQRNDRRSKAAAMYGVCDHLGIFKEALTKAGRPHRTTFVTGLEAMSYTSAVTFAIGYGPDRHDGVSAVRTLKFVRECPCFRFTSGVRRV